MPNLTDKDIVTVILDEHKLAASALTTLILESSNQFLRNDATSILNRTFQHQKQIFDLMNQKGWYQVQAASNQEINSAKQAIGNVASTFNM